MFSSFIIGNNEQFLNPRLTVSVITARSCGCARTPVERREAGGEEEEHCGDADDFAAAFAAPRARRWPRRRRKGHGGPRAAVMLRGRSTQADANSRVLAGGSERARASLGNGGDEKFLDGLKKGNAFEASRAALSVGRALACVSEGGNGSQENRDARTGRDGRVSLRGPTSAHRERER